MGAGKWRKEYAEALRGKDVVVFGDIDEPDESGRLAGQEHTEEVLSSLNGKARSLKHVILPNEFHDISDYIQSLKHRQYSSADIAQTITELINGTPVIDQAAAPKPEQDRVPESGEDDDAAIARLAALKLEEYERVRIDEAKKLKFRPSFLDKLVRAQRLLMHPRSEIDNLQGIAVHLEDVKPWPDPVDGAEILNVIAARFGHYAVLPEGAADTLALWDAHTHMFKRFQKSPRLYISAPTEECGKSTLLNCSSLFCARAKRTDNMTTAVMFRLVTGHSPTILADECDKWLFSNLDLVGIVQSGAEKGGTVMRCEGDSNDLREFGCYAPFALAAIGKLPSQLHSRSIVIRLERAKREEMKNRARFDFDKVEYEKENLRVMLLADIQQIFAGEWPPPPLDQSPQPIEQAFSKDLIELLAAMKDRPWPDINYGKPISQRWLAVNLSSFGIQSHNIRNGKEQFRGYDREQFDKVFDRYISENAGGPHGTSVQASQHL
jgi:putative DNA primase/helicase